MDDLRWYDGRSGEERRRKIEVCVDVRCISEVYIFMIESGCFQPPCKRCIIRFFAMRLESSLLAKDNGLYFRGEWNPVRFFAMRLESSLLAKDGGV